MLYIISHEEPFTHSQQSRETPPVMINSCGTVGLFLLRDLLSLVTTVSGQVLSPLSENELIVVTGREGLAVELDLDATIDGLAFIYNNGGGAD